jgi:hypothetical protein
MWRSVGLLLSLTGLVLGQSELLVEYKKNFQGITIYKYGVGGYSKPTDYDLVDGSNMVSGDFTYLTTPSFYNERLHEFSICDASFEGINTHLLSGTGCDEHLVSGGIKTKGNYRRITGRPRFYAYKDRPNNGQYVEVFLSQCRELENRFSFTRLSIGQPSCPSGTHNDFNETFYVEESRIACPQDETNVDNGQITYPTTNNLFASSKNLRCNAGYAVEGRNSVDCSDN